MTQERQLFILISSPQNLGNLPPVLETAQRGDLVVWIESPVTQRNQWSDGATRVLTKFGLEVLPSPVVINPISDSLQIASAIASIADQWKDKAKLVIVANGTTKLSHMGLLDAIKGQTATMVLGNERPAELWKYVGGLDAPPQIEPYQNSRLDLREILSVIGHELFRDTKPQRIWPLDDSETPALSASEAYYGVDPGWTQQVHRAQETWDAAKRDEQSTSTSFADVARLLGVNELNKFKSSFGEVIEKAKKSGTPGKGKKPGDRNEKSKLTLADQDWATLYNLTLELAEKGKEAKIKQTVRPPAEPVGPLFERAVVKRLIDLLSKTNGFNQVVRSVWQNVVVCQSTQPATKAAEFDILLVLVNGNLLHIDCSTFQLQPKELDQRLLSLQQAGSLLTQMAICGPLFTPFAEDDWFRRAHEVRRHIESVGRLPFIPFTFKVQPDEYVVSNSGDQVERATCPTFEQAVNRFLGSFKRVQESRPPSVTSPANEN